MSRSALTKGAKTIESASSVSAFSSPPPYGAMPAWHEDALNNRTRRR